MQSPLPSTDADRTVQLLLSALVSSHDESLAPGGVAAASGEAGARRARVTKMVTDNHADAVQVLKRASIDGLLPVIAAATGIDLRRLRATAYKLSSSGSVDHDDYAVLIAIKGHVGTIREMIEKEHERSAGGIPF